MKLSHPGNHDYTWGFWSLGSEALHGVLHPSKMRISWRHHDGLGWLESAEGTAKKSHPFIHPERQELPGRSHTRTSSAALQTSRST